MVFVNADQLTGRLIDEGARLLAEQGPAGLSLRTLAARAGTSTMAVYTRFGDKQALLAAMRREGFRRLGRRLQKATAQTEDPLTGLAHAYRRAALDSPHLYNLMFGPLPAGFLPDEVDDDAAAATYTPLVEGVRAAVERGIFAGDPERIALHLWVVAHGMVSLELSRMLPIPPKDAARRYEEAMLFAAQPFTRPAQ